MKLLKQFDKFTILSKIPVRNYNVGSNAFHITAHTKTLRAPSVAKKVSRTQN